MIRRERLCTKVIARLRQRTKNGGKKEKKEEKIKIKWKKKQIWKKEDKTKMKRKKKQKWKTEGKENWREGKKERFKKRRKRREVKCIKKQINMKPKMVTRNEKTLFEGKSVRSINRER